MKKQDSGKHRMGYINRTVNRRLAGLSIVELMVALTLLAIVSIAGLQIMQMSQSSYSAGRSSFATQQKY
jgi:Tfp pilus assembly protein PilW